MKISIGIIHDEPGWEILFSQIGLSWKAISASDEITPETFSAVVVNASPSSLQEKVLADYLASGGAILAVKNYAHPLTRAKSKSKYFTSLPPSMFDGFHQGSMMDIYASGFTDADSSKSRHPLPIIYRVGKGIIATIPFDINALILDGRSKRKNFYFEKDRLPNEIVATVSKGALRKFVTEVLQFLHHARNIPFIHKWYFPEDRQTIFTFRVDSDQGSPGEVDELYALCRDHGIQTMWFIDTKSHEKWLSHFNNFDRQEIGIHCYEHMTFPTEEKNLQNILKALSLLNAQGLHPKGAAAPYGTWNIFIASVFEHIGAGFSSEFGLDYDDLPFFPYVNGKFSPVLQLPIHPICVGSMRRVGYTADDMKNYFLQLVDTRLADREPLCLYHHPTHHHLDLFADVFKYIRSKKIDNYSYSEYASWWRIRNQTRWMHDFDNAKNDVIAECSDGNAGVHWRIVFPSGEESITNAEGTVHLQSLPHRPPTAKPDPPKDIARSRTFDVRHLVVNLLDAWYKRTQ
ncbi:MAG TPA: hypothetical protein VMF88_05605 [Bacteroidota bacterium]|nr:hypothetical protein [Bacteroidota bacterium]